MMNMNMNSSAASRDVASMSAARNPSKTAPPTPSRDGFDLISRQPIVWDVDKTVGKTVNLDQTVAYEYTDITYHISTQDMCARISFNRPQVLHAFRPRTIREIQLALTDATEDPNVAVILLDSNISQDFTASFCAGGDQTVRSNAGGYQDASERVPALRVLDLQVQMRRCPKPVVAVVRGYAVGGGHILAMLADLTLASENAVFGQTGPRMGSFDAGYGSVHAADLMGQKRARELWFLSRFYSAQQAVSFGLANACFPDDELDGHVGQWVRRMVMNSPTAIACCKAALNAGQDGAAGLAQMGGELTRLFYQSEEAQEGRQAFLEKRAPNFRSRM
jgi:naphthoate synthase